MDIVFVVDGSGSIRDNNPQDGSYDNWQFMVDFILAFVDSIEIGQQANRVGLVLFGNDAQKLWGLTKYFNKNELKTRVRELIHDYNDNGENTNTQSGIKMMRNQLFGTNEDRPGSKNVAIVITDGVSTVQKENTIPEANAAKNAGITVYVVAVTNAIDETEIKDMSSEPKREGENYFLSHSFEDLVQVLDEILMQTCGRVITRPAPSPAPTTTTTTTTAPDERKGHITYNLHNVKYVITRKYRSVQYPLII